MKSCYWCVRRQDECHPLLPGDPGSDRRDLQEAAPHGARGQVVFQAAVLAKPLITRLVVERLWEFIMLRLSLQSEMTHMPSIDSCTAYWKSVPGDLVQ
jgi:hypothetical protein